jgi:adenine deaminase
MFDLTAWHVAMGDLDADVVVRSGRLVDVITGEIYPADVAISGNQIAAVGSVDRCVGDRTQIVDAGGAHLVPGLIDGHLHVECSKLSITRFAQIAAPLGTTSIISGLDQVFVVAGLEGVREFLDEAAKLPLSIFWGAPCKVPYTYPVTSVGHTFGTEELLASKDWPECIGIWEALPDYLIHEDPEVLALLELARSQRLPLFGAAPMASGPIISAWATTGVRVDHESYTNEELVQKLRNGINVMIRESTIAHFLAENIKVVLENPALGSRIAFCTDDMTAPDLLERGHLDNVIRLAIGYGVSPITAVQMATVNCAQFYRIDDQVGIIAPGRRADILIVDDLNDFRPRQVIAKGKVLTDDGRLIQPLEPPPRSAGMLRSFPVSRVAPDELAIAVDQTASGGTAVAVCMQLTDVPFVRRRREVEVPVEDGVIVARVEDGINYAAAVEAYGKSGNRAAAFVSGFGLRRGAFASSACPDDNNIIAVGATLEDLAFAINTVMELHGAQVVVEAGEVVCVLPLEVAGIVSDAEAERVAELESALESALAERGCSIDFPFMQLAFMGITAVPDLGLTERGLVDNTRHEIISPVLITSG